MLKTRLTTPLSSDSLKFGQSSERVLTSQKSSRHPLLRGEYVACPLNPVRFVPSDVPAVAAIPSCLVACHLLVLLPCLSRLLVPCLPLSCLTVAMFPVVASPSRCFVVVVSCIVLLLKSFPPSSLSSLVLHHCCRFLILIRYPRENDPLYHLYHFLQALKNVTCLAHSIYRFFRPFPSFLRLARRCHHGSFRPALSSSKPHRLPSNHFHSIPTVIIYLYLCCLLLGAVSYPLCESHGASSCLHAVVGLTFTGIRILPARYK